MPDVKTLIFQKSTKKLLAHWYFQSFRHILFLFCQDMSCKRNAFMMLIHADQDRALNYLSSCIEEVTDKFKF